MQAKQILFEGTSWTADRARLTMPILLLMAKSSRKLTYKDLDLKIAREYGRSITPVVVGYGRVLEIVGRSLNQLSVEWGIEIPPLTILVVNNRSGEPSPGVNQFLQRYVSKSSAEEVTIHNRRVMIERATNAVHNYRYWDEVAAYFEVDLSDLGVESDPIALESPPPRIGSESAAHLALKNHIAEHPELFAEIGQFPKGRVEYSLKSGDKVDVFFNNSEQALAVEIKTGNASLGELTRGLYQCVKYRAVLRAMYDIEGELVNAQAILVTPRQLPEQYQQAANRLGVFWRCVETGR